MPKVQMDPVWGGGGVVPCWRKLSFQCLGDSISRQAWLAAPLAIENEEVRVDVAGPAMIFLCQIRTPYRIGRLGVDWFGVLGPMWST